MARSLVAITGGLSRVGVPALPALVARDDEEQGSADLACCMICGCPGGPCALPATPSTGVEGGPGCPFLPHHGRRGSAAFLRDTELLSLVTASVIVIASVVLVTL